MIPNEAIEAAVRTLPGFTPDEEADSYERETNDVGRAMVERILTAGAPHMLATAWDEGFEGAQGVYHQTNPYRKVGGAA